MKNRGKKFCSFLLAALMIMSMLPMTAFATSGNTVRYRLCFNGAHGRTAALICTRQVGTVFNAGNACVTNLNCSGLWSEFEEATNYGEMTDVKAMHEYWDTHPVDGITFKGWFTEPEGGEEVEVGSIIGVDILDGDRLYAHWEKDGQEVDEVEVPVLDLLQEDEADFDEVVMALQLTEKESSVSKDDIDAILAAGMKDVNAKMMAKDKGYAMLVANSDGSGFTVEMYNPEYKIVGSDGQNVYDDIIGTLVTHLNKSENRAKVKKLSASGINEAIDLTNDVNSAEVAAFAKALVKTQVQDLQPTGAISQLNGKTYTIIIVDVNDKEYSYTITFTTKAEDGYTTTEEEIDAIIQQGIEASNAAMNNGGKPYAELSELSENNEVTVMMYDGSYPIKKDGNDVYTNIIGVLVNKLFENRGKVTSIAAVTDGVAATEGPGLIKLDSLQGSTEEDASTVVQFILKLGLKGKNGDALQAAGGIGQLDGQSFQVEVTGKGTEPVKVTYTVKFELKVELVLTPDAEAEGDAKIEITEDENGDKTLTGTDLVDGNKGLDVKDVVDKFEDVTSSGSYTVKVVKEEAGGTQTVLNDSEAVGTGSKIQLCNAEGDVIDEITIIVKGDTDGTGIIDNVDAQKVLNHVVKTPGKILEGVYAVAGHMGDADAELTNVDAQIILNVASDKN